MCYIPPFQFFGGPGLVGAIVALTGSAVGVMTGRGGMLGAGIVGGGGGVAPAAGHRDEQMVMTAFTCT
jgi:hypothetical protein